VYRTLGLQFIEPELREGRGEIEAALKKALPALVEVADLQGDLHMHTTASDGGNSIEEMAAAAQEKGYRYIAITDHSQSLKITNGLTEKRLREHIRAIEKVNARLKDFVILKSAEVDILEDGTLDYSNGMLKQLDFTICSVHSRFALNKEQQTERIMRAMDNPYFKILGHATGRLLLKRQGYDLDMERIMRHAKDRGCFFEINSSPNRLDLSDEHAKLAKQLSIKIAVNTDAHSIHELDFIAAGINQARRGWLEPADVLNTLPIAKLLKVLRL
jgi:DNA polymerase (family 10)